MILFDVNIFINAHREDQTHHAVARELLEDVVNGPEPFGLSELALSGFIRAVSHPRALSPATPTEQAIDFAEDLFRQPNARIVRPGERHWGIFETICRHLQLRGNLVADAYHAALAIEHGCEWISFDRDFAKFPSLRWRHPLD